MHLQRLVMVLFLMTAALFAAPVKVVITPASASINTAQTVEFIATVTNATTTTAVTWTKSAGSFTFTGTTWATYTPPTTPGTYTVTATSVADPTKKAIATVTVTAAPAVSVAISPTAATLMRGDEKNFSATVSNALDPSVTWSVTGGTAQVLSSTVMKYTAGVATGTFQVTATSVADPSKIATATITLVPEAPALSLNPTSATLTAYTTQSVSAAFTHAADTRLSWSATGGTITPGQTEGVSTSVAYQAPALKGTYVLTATSVADPTNKVTATFTVVDPAAPTIYDLKVGSQTIDPAVGTGLTPLFFAGGAAATLDNGLGTAASGTTYTVKPATFTQYLLTLKKSGKVVGTRLSDWVAPVISATATKDTALNTATAYGQRKDGQSVVIRPDGKIVVAGGGSIIAQTVYLNGSPGNPDTAIIPIPDERMFDPTTGTVTTTQGVIRANHAPLLTANGRIRNFGGTLRDGTIYDSTVATYGGLVSMSEGFRNRYSGARIFQSLDGRTVVIGGVEAYTEYSSANHTSYYITQRMARTDWVEIQDPATGVIESMKMQYKRQDAAALLLRDGRVFVAGGGWSYDGNSTDEQPEVLNLTAKTSSLPAGLKVFWDTRTSTPISKVSGAALMADGKVLLVEDVIATGTRWMGIWDPVADTYTRRRQTAQWNGWTFLAEPIGDGIYPLGFTTRNPSSTEGRYIVLYDSVKNAVVVSEELMFSTPAGLAGPTRWLGLTAQGDALIEIGYSLGWPNSYPVREPWRVKFNLPVVTFPGSASIPLGQTQKFTAWSSTNQPMTWSVMEWATGGTITSEGIYRAPITAGIYHVVATGASGRSVSTVRVLPSPPLVNSVTLDRTSGPVGCAVNVSWDVRAADTIRLQIRDGSGGTILQDLDVSGQTTAAITVPAGAYSFNVVATNLSGQASNSASFQLWTVYSVSVVPSGTTYLTPGASKVFTAQVNAAADTPRSVTWSYSGGQITADGVYTAPVELGTYTVTATSTFDPSKSAQASIQVGLPATLNSFTTTKYLVAPGQGASLNWVSQGATSQTLTRIDVYGGGSGNWNVTGMTSYGAAPGRTSIYTLTVNNGFGGESKNLKIFVGAPRIFPSQITLKPGETRLFEARLGDEAGAGIIWTASDGLITIDGLYTAPATPGTYVVTGTSATESVLTAQAAVTVPALVVDPTDIALGPGEVFQFVARTPAGTPVTVGWSVVEASGGSIAADGNYTAPQDFGTYHVKATAASGATATANVDVGLIETIVVTPDIEVLEAGTYVLTVRLRANNGKEMDGKRTLDLPTGPASIEVPFETQDILKQLVVGGPYQVVRVRVDKVEPDDLVPADEKLNLGATQAYGLAQFQRPLLKLTGTATATGVDTNGNGKFDILTVQVGVDTLVPGTYSCVAQLVDKNGAAIQGVTGTATLTAGTGTITLRFTGTKISRNGVDGPYSLGSIMINGPVGTLGSLKDAVTGFLASQFEAAPAASAPKVVPPKAKVNAQPGAAGRPLTESKSH